MFIQFQRKLSLAYLLNISRASVMCKCNNSLSCSFNVSVTTWAALIIKRWDEKQRKKNWERGGLGLRCAGEGGKYKALTPPLYSWYLMDYSYKVKVIHVHLNNQKLKLDINYSQIVISCEYVFFLLINKLWQLSRKEKMSLILKCIASKSDYLSEKASLL